MLNALRHQRTDHIAEHARAGRSQFGAQRLAASTNRSHLVGVRFVRNALCVLNALRHQRTDHARLAQLVLLSSPEGAQRLAASTNRSRFVNLRQLGQRTGAQRLAASTNRSPFVRSSSTSVRVQCSTPCGINEQITSPTRGSLLSRCSTPCGINEQITSYLPQIHGFDQQCSTPCGINEQITQITDRTREFRGNVLNALRHQRTDHTVTVAHHDSKASQCSTPCGIIEQITRFDVPSTTCDEVLNALRHQRTDHRRADASNPLHGRVLNALRHHRTDHRCG